MIKSSSKRKWIVGGVMFFGGVALLTTGFATWVIGTQVMKQEGNIGVTVDTAVNQSITIKATLAPNEAFYLGETGVTSTGGNTIVSTEGGKAADFDVVFQSVEIQCGNDYFEKHFKNNTAFDLKLRNKVDAALAPGQVNLSDKNNIATVGNLLGETIRPTASSWTYIDLDERTNNVIPDGSTQKWGKADNNQNINVLKLTDVKFTFGWGTFFDKKAPSTYYNGHYDAIHNDLTKIDAVHKELDAMRTAFTAENGVLPFELSLVPGTVVA